VGDSQPLHLMSHYAIDALNRKTALMAYPLSAVRRPNDQEGKR
jgi:hypothetical protein